SEFLSGPSADRSGPGQDRRSPRRLELPPGEVDDPSDGVELPPGEVDDPPDGVELPPGEVDDPPGGVELPPGEVDDPPDGVELPPGEVDDPPDGVELPPGEVDDPPGGVELPPGEVDDPPDGVELPPGEVDDPPGDVELPPGRAQGPGQIELSPGRSNVSSARTNLFQARTELNQARGGTVPGHQVRAGPDGPITCLVALNPAREARDYDEVISWQTLSCQISIGNILQRRHRSTRSLKQEPDVAVDVPLAAMDLQQQSHLRVGDRRYVEERRLPFEALAPGDALKADIAFRAGLQEQEQDRRGAVVVRIDGMEKRGV